MDHYAIAPPGQHASDRNGDDQAEWIAREDERIREQRDTSAYLWSKAHMIVDLVHACDSRRVAVRDTFDKLVDIFGEGQRIGPSVKVQD